MRRSVCLLCLILSVLLSACGGNNTEEKPSSNPPPPEPRPAPAPIQEAVADPAPDTVDYNSLNPAIVEDLKALEERYPMAPYYFELDGQRWYYITMEQAATRSGERIKFKQLGLVNPQLEEVLPPVYDQIFNPDATAKGYVELLKDGQHGLYGYRNRILLSPSYDLIFPPIQHEDAIAIGQKGKQFWAIMPDGSRQEIRERNMQPLYASIPQHLGFNYQENGYLRLFSSYSKFSKVDPQDTYVCFSPSYLANLNIFPEVFSHSEYDNDNGAFGYISEVQENDSWTYSLLGAFVTTGIEVRSDIEDVVSSELITVDTYNEHVHSVDLPGDNPRFVATGLIESFKDFPSSDLHDYMQEYVYFKVLDDGRIKELNSDRIFAFTQFVKMDSSYFRVNWADEIRGEEGSRFYEVLFGKYYTIDDLDVMRNEIFASYGYRFKSERWQTYFGKQKWYRPRFDNVDDQLTEIDRHNISLILEQKKDMEQHPEKYPEPKKEQRSMDGPG